jgi:dTDP-4-dehydrorhamnose reductase
MTRVLVTGASGLLGASLSLLASEAGAEVVGTYHRHELDLPGVRMVAADLLPPGAGEELVARERPEWVVHCAGGTDVDACEQDPRTAERLNRDLAQEVARASRSAGAGLVHISTDAVFAGDAGPYAEGDPLRPLNVYGRTKLEAEQRVLAEHDRAIVVRTNFFGWSATGRRGLAEWFWNRLEAGRECPGFTDVWFNPLLVTDLARTLLGLMDLGVPGVVHVAGGTCASKFEFGQALARAFGYDAELVRPATSDGAGLRAPRPKRLCLAVGRAERLLRRRMPSLEAALERMAGEEGSAMRTRLRAAAAGRPSSSPRRLV